MKVTQLLCELTDTQAMALFSFPVHSPVQVSVAPSRLIKDSVQVVDYIHKGEVERLRKIFDEYMLPDEQHALAMEQFAAIVGISAKVDSRAVKRMRGLLNDSTVNRDTDVDGVEWLSYDDTFSGSYNAPAQWIQQLRQLTERFNEASVRLRHLDDKSKRRERTLAALQELAHLSQHFNKECEAILSAGNHEEYFDKAYYDSYSSDIHFFIDNRDDFLELFLKYVTDGLPKVTKPYLIPRDRMEIGAMAVAVASGSEALFQTLYERAKTYPDRYNLEQLTLSKDWRGMLLWQDQKLTVELMAERALRLLRFQARERSEQRIQKMPFLKRRLALQRFRQDKA